jgi:Zn-dependent protease with chaperone function
LIPIVYLIGPLALCVLLASALVGAALIAGRRRLARLEPSAQSRIALTAAIAPAFLGAVFASGAIYDIVLSGTADFCLHHHDSSEPSLILLLSVAILAGRLLTYGIQTIVVVLRAVRLGCALPGAAPKAFMGCLVLPVEEPQAYVLGFLKPRVYVSQGLLERTNEDDLASVLAHERAHAARRDPLRRLIASLGLVLHLPGIAHLLDRLLTRTQEMAADADAAIVVGDRIRVAESLVRFARLQASSSGCDCRWRKVAEALARFTRLQGPVRAAVMEFGSGDLEARVRELLDPHQRRGLSPVALLGCSAALCLLALFAAHGLHYLAQALLLLP